MSKALELLANIVNGASRPQDTSAAAIKVCTVPLELLKLARDHILEECQQRCVNHYFDELAANQIEHAAKRVW